MSGQIQPKTGLAESHQIKLICKKKCAWRECLLVLGAKCEAQDTDSEDRRSCSITGWVGKQILILKLTLGSLGGAPWKQTPKTQFECTECLGTAIACTLDIIFLIAIREK